LIDLCLIASPLGLKPFQYIAIDAKCNLRLGFCSYQLSLQLLFQVILIGDRFGDHSDKLFVMTRSLQLFNHFNEQQAEWALVTGQDYVQD
jgi:hypothetical protein